MKLISLQDNKYPLTLAGREITKHSMNILDNCCWYGADGKQLWGLAMSGQQFTDALGGGWNVIIGYGHCGHPATQKPSTIGGWGVNKSCARWSEYVG